MVYLHAHSQTVHILVYLPAPCVVPATNWPCIVYCTISIVTVLNQNNMKRVLANISKRFLLLIRKMDVIIMPGDSRSKI